MSSTAASFPTPGCPYAVLSLGEMEWFVATVLAGVDGGKLVRALPGSKRQAEAVMLEAAQEVGVERPINPMLESIFDDLMTPSPVA